MTLATNPESASSATTTGLGAVNQIVKDFGALIMGVGGVIAALVFLRNEILPSWDGSSLLTRMTLFAVFGVIGLVAAFAVYAQFISPWLERRRRQRVVDLVETDLPLKPATFRLRPYEEADHDDYHRPDGAHDLALRWLDEADATCLYLTGFSGTGKSSLLQAWLIPELAVADRPVRSVVVRSFADPIGQLVDALKADDAVPIDLTAEETDPRVLLERAADAMCARNGRFLVAIDQFEECLILQDEATKAGLADLFGSLQKNPIEGLQLLFVLRTDYLKFDELTALGLPDPRPRENWFNLEALSHADARSILRRASFDMSPSLENKVLDEASDVDDLPGLIRPITLNMMGLVLKNFAGAALTRTAPGRLIQDFLTRAIEKPGIDQLAPKLLAEMITDKGTKKPMAEAALASAAGIEPSLTRKTLYLLGDEGVVRELDRGEKVWEISHDFVARQLGQIIPRLRPSWWQQAQKAATPVALVAWLVILGAGYPIYQTWQESHVFSLFQAEGVTIHGEPGQYRITFDNAKDGAVDKLFSHVERLDPISLVISLVIWGNAQLQELPGLDGLDRLQSLLISDNAQLQELPGLDGLDRLQSLEIRSNAQLQELPGLDGLDSLQSLEISLNDQLQELPGLDGLDRLQSLEISGNAQLQELPGLDGLDRLQSLEISLNAQLQELPSLKASTNLNVVRISGNGKILDMPPLGNLDSLAVIAFDAADVETSIEALKGMPDGVIIETNFDIDDFSDRLMRAREEQGLTSPLKVAPFWSTLTE